MYAVEVKGLCKRFGSTQALDNVSLQIPRGKVFGLLGPNGAGKTTLISILSGLTTADSGSAKVLGLDVHKHTREVRRRINVLRGFSGAPHGLKAIHLMEYYMRLYNCWNEKRARELLESVGLLENTSAVSEFSSGMRQRFFLAKVQCNDPEVLFMDEPTVGLDVEAAIALRRKIRELRQTGKTILLSTHYMLEAEELCDEIALINKGKIIARGTPRQLKGLVKEREVVRVFSPDARSVARLLQRIPSVWAVSPKRDFVEAEVRDHRVLKRILSALASSKYLDVTCVEMVEPPLEEAFLRLVKKK